MKKILILAGIIALSFTTRAFAADVTGQVSTNETQKIDCSGGMQQPKCGNKAKFEKRLKLTDTQKEQAKEIHKKGFEEIKPIMEKMDLKREEIEAVKRSGSTPEAQAERITQLKKELRSLRKEARDVQMKNMKEFESILTKKQAKELNKMKKEGRKQFEKKHKKFLKMPPIDGMGGGPRPPMD